MDLDGPSWREKLSPIPSVPTSVQLRAWRPTAGMPPDQVGDSSNHHQPGTTGRGNQHHFFLRVILSLVYIFTVKQKNKHKLRL